MQITTKELEPSLWRELERLFGSNGACGGCWCMAWRTAKGEDWSRNKGAINKARLKELVTSGKAHGILAFCNDQPVGWCSFDRRLDYLKLNRSRSLKCDDADQVWSIPCFFVHRDFRRKGVGSILLREALRAMKKMGVGTVEAYPVNPYSYGKSIPAAFAWTGTREMFEKEGFTLAGNPDGGKQRVRKYL